MKVQIICEKCCNIVELTSKNYSDTYVQQKLNNVNMHCTTDIEVSINSDIDDIKEMNDVSSIDTEYEVNNIEFTCNQCGDYIQLHTLT